MASGRLLIPSWMPALDSDGDPISGVKAYFYVNLTTTLASIFSNEALTTPLTNPVEANSSGRFPAIWADGDVLYSVAIEAPYGPAGVPFSYDNLSASLGADIATAEAAEAAADDANAALAATLEAIETATEVGGGSAALAGALAGATAGTAAANAAIAANVFTQAGTGAVSRTYLSKARERVSVDDYGAVGDNTADDTAAIQACFDANPNATVTFVGGKTYRCVGSITLVNASGKNFQGDIDGQGATVNFVTAGSSSATDADMQNGFVVYPTLNGTGGDITGMRQSRCANITLVGPTNGCGFRLTNTQNFEFNNIRTLTNRYGIVEESCINVSHINCTFEDSINAGVGLLRTLNANVWYRDPNTAWWNDSPVFVSCGFKNGLQTQPLAHILDHGSASLPQRKAIGCYFYSRWDGYVGSMISTQFGIVSRNACWSVDTCWFENVTRPIRALEQNSLEPTNLEGVAGAQPSGTYAVASIPNGFSYAYSCKNTSFARAFVEQEVSGIRGVARMSGNISLFIRNGATSIKSITTSTNQVVIDDGNSIIGPLGTYTYTSFVNGLYIDPKAQWQSWTPTITASSGTITSVTGIACKYSQRGKVVQITGSFTITTNGTGAGTLLITPPVLAATRGGFIGAREVAVNGFISGGQIDGSQMTLVRYDNTYPAANGCVFVFSGTYQAA